LRALWWDKLVDTGLKHKTIDTFKMYYLSKKSNNFEDIIISNKTQELQINPKLQRSESLIQKDNLISNENENNVLKKMLNEEIKDVTVYDSDYRDILDGYIIKITKDDFKIYKFSCFYNSNFIVWKNQNKENEEIVLINNFEYIFNYPNGYKLKSMKESNHIEYDQDAKELVTNIENHLKNYTNKPEYKLLDENNENKNEIELFKAKILDGDNSFKQGGKSKKTKNHKKTHKKKTHKKKTHKKKTQKRKR